MMTMKHSLPSANKAAAPGRLEGPALGDSGAFNNVLSTWARIRGVFFGGHHKAVPTLRYLKL